MHDFDKCSCLAILTILKNITFWDNQGEDTSACANIVLSATDAGTRGSGEDCSGDRKGEGRGG